MGNIRKNYVFNLFYQIVSFIIPLLTAPYLTRVLGANQLGTFSFYGSIVAYFVLFANLGTKSFAQREICVCSKDRETMSNIFWDIKGLQICLGIISLIVYFYFGFNYELEKIYFIFSLEIISNVLDVSWLFQSLEKFSFLTIRNVILKVINLMCVFIYIKDKNDLNVYVILYTINLMVGSLLFWLSLNKFVDFKIPNLKVFKEYLSCSFFYFIPTVATSVYTLLDKTMIGLICNDSAYNGYYQQAYNLSTILTTVITSLGIVVMPRMGHYFARNDFSSLSDILNKSINFVFFIGIPIVFGTWAISDFFIPWYLGKDFIQTAYLLDIMIPIVIFIGVSSITGSQVLVIMNKVNIVTKSIIIGALINFVLNLILIHKFNAIGAAISSVFAEFTIMSIQLLSIGKLFSVKKVFKKIPLYCFSGILMFITVKSLVNSFSLINFSFLLVTVCTGAIVYFAVLLIAKDEFIYIMIYSIKNINLLGSRK